MISNGDFLNIHEVSLPHPFIFYFLARFSLFKWKVRHSLLLKETFFQLNALVLLFSAEQLLSVAAQFILFSVLSCISVICSLTGAKD